MSPVRYEQGFRNVVLSSCLEFWTIEEVHTNATILSSQFLIYFDGNEKRLQLLCLASLPERRKLQECVQRTMPVCCSKRF
jgi:hypothetical protein